MDNPYPACERGAIEYTVLGILVRKQTLMAQIPPSLIGTCSTLLSDRYTHAELNALFMSAGFEGDPPEGNKVQKCQEWMRRANKGLIDPISLLGRLIGEYMDEEFAAGIHPFGNIGPDGADPRTRVISAAAKDGLTYIRGGKFIGKDLAAPSATLSDALAERGIEAAEEEFRRAYENVTRDPAAAITAACAILETVCKTYLEATGSGLPSRQTLGPLWTETARKLGLHPEKMVEDDFKKILQGLFSVVDGIAALRTHVGSAHGRSGARPAKTYRVTPRHARLAVHAAHTASLFVLETWQARELP